MTVLAVSQKQVSEERVQGEQVVLLQMDYVLQERLARHEPHPLQQMRHGY
jgi:hypothetical protein